MTVICRPSDLEIVELEAGAVGAPVTIPHTTAHTIAIITEVQGPPTDLAYAELPAGAAIGDVVEVYSLRNSGSNGDINVRPVSGEKIGIGTGYTTGADMLFRKISTTVWRRLA